MNAETFFIASSAALTLSPLKIVLIFASFIAWAWLVATKLEKDARYYHLSYHMWNGIFLGSGAVALVVMLLIPGWVHIFWVTWPLGLLVLAAPVLAYWRVRNQAVPESKKFHITSSKLGSLLEQRQKARASRQATIHFTDSQGKIREAPVKDDPLHEVYALAEELAIPAISARATRVEVAVSPKGCQVSQTIDGVRYKREPLSVEPAIRLIDFLKDVAGLDVEDRRKQQQGRFSLKGPDGEVDVHLVTAGSSSSQVMRLDFDRANRLIKPYDGLGLLPAQMEAIQSLGEAESRHGIVLVSAPTGHGLTTTLYSFLNRHDAYTTNIKTLEREIQVDLDGVDQSQWDARNPDSDYATNLQSILRRDPDIVMIGELKDKESARVAIEPGHDGPLMYIPIRSGSIPEALREWCKLVGDPKKAVKPLRFVTTQRLLRSLCPNCRQPYQPTLEQLKKLGVPAGKIKQLYRASGKIQVKNKIETCSVCGGTGYLGQTAAFEIMPVDDEVQKHIAAGDLKAAVNHARRNKMVYLQEAALTKVVNGETSLDELIRVTSPGKKKKTQAPQPA